MKSRPPLDLDPRKQLILRAVVHDHVATAEPVGSETLVLRYPLGVKPATVRNELAEMSDMGYLYQPHTSAGRVPSTVGYRYFVDRLMQCSPIADSVRERLRQIPEKHGELVHLLGETCRMLAQLTRYTSMAMTLSDPGLTIRQIVLSPISSTRLLLVLVFSSGHVENRLFDAPDHTSLDDLGKASEALSIHVIGQPLRSVSARAVPGIELNQRARRIFDRALKQIKTVARDQTRGKLLIAGEMHILEQPEFQRDIAQLESLIEALDEQSAVLQSFDSTDAETVRVTIGKEHVAESIHACSIVASRFYSGMTEVGSIGVLGPTRMRYEEVVPVVEIMAQSLTNVLTRLAAI